MRFLGVDQTVAQNYEAGDWATEGALASPGAGVLLADTGELPTGIYEFSIFIDSEVVAAVSIEHRNAANTATLKGQYARISDNTRFNRLYIAGYKMGANERLRIVNGVAIVGGIQASIIYIRRV